MTDEELDIWHERFAEQRRGFEKKLKEQKQLLHNAEAISLQRGLALLEWERVGRSIQRTCNNCWEDEELCALLGVDPYGGGEVGN